MKKSAEHRTDRTREMPAGRPKKPQDQLGVHIGLLMPPDLVKRVDAETERLAAENGLKTSRSQVLVKLIRLGLEASAKSRPEK